MKKMILTIAAVVAISGSAMANGIMWGNTVAITDRAGASIEPGSSITVNMWRDGGNATIDGVSGMWTSAGDDTVIAGYTSDWGGGGQFYSDNEAFAAVGNGSTVFTRLQDASGGGWYANVGALTTVSLVDPAIDPVANSFDYTLAGRGTWTPVPEPATMALLGLGALTLGYRRIRK